MCLLTGIKKLIVKEDILCYKVLTKNPNGTYSTPCQRTNVELNKEMVAGDLSIEYNNRRNSVGGGFIHALLYVEDEHGGFGNNDIVFEAVIPSGTEFFVDDELRYICARKMFITDKVIKKAVNAKSIDIIMEAIADAYPQNIEGDKVAIGDFCMTDDNGNKTYIHRSDYTPEKDDNIIGVVGFFNENGKPITISRVEAKKAWCTLPWLKRPLINEPVSFSLNYNTYKKSLNGKELTEKVLKSIHYDAKYYSMFKWISKYKTKGTKSGDWYIGAIGELVILAENTNLINVSLRMLNGATRLKNRLWSSSEYTYHNALSFNPVNGIVNNNSGKGYIYRVRAFAAF